VFLGLVTGLVLVLVLVWVRVLWVWCRLGGASYVGVVGCSDFCCFGFYRDCFGLFCEIFWQKSICGGWVHGEEEWETWCWTKWPVRVF